MKRSLADVNLLLPLLVRHHAHHALALGWFDGLAAGEAVLCRFVQLALVRLLGNTKVMKAHALPASDAWTLMDRLLEDERMDFSPEPANVDAILPKLFKFTVPTPKLIADAYLAAFSIAGQMRLATIDGGFRQFRGLDLHLLTPNAP